MRTIKFRGKRVDNGEWVYGDYHRRAGNVHTIIEMEPDEDGKVCYALNQVVPDTVGQFTGLVDNNGTEIYEGDVIDFMAYDAIGNERGKEQGVVRFAFCSYLIGGYDMYDVLINDDEVEVIGNIHDNPELLKQNE